LKQALTLAVTVVLATVPAAACSAAPNGAENAYAARHPASTASRNNVTDANLPINQRFHNLDEYLAWLQQYAGPVDRPWYKEIRPGVYELQTGNFHGDGAQQKRIFTRKDLEKKFGFSK
jgi:hypothetical protein